MVNDKKVDSKYVGKYMIVISRPVSRERASGIGRVFNGARDSDPDAADDPAVKLLEIVVGKWVVVRQVKPGDKASFINLDDGVWNGKFEDI